MHRRTLLAALPTTLALGGCSALESPEIRMDSGSGKLTPAADRQIAHGLQPGGNARVYATVVPDEASDLITESTDDTFVDTLSNDGGDVFTLVLQLRSTPEAPMSIHLTAGGDLRVRGETLHAPVTVEPWGSFDRLDDAEQRERYRSAAELVYTSVWNLTPALDSLPTDVDLHLSQRT